MALNLPPHSSNWDKVGDAFYRKEEIYRMSWPVIDLSFYRVVGAPFAGPVALTFDTTKPIPVLDPSSSMPSSTRPRIHVYSCSGQLLHTVVWDHPSSLVCFGFTNAESLVTVSSNGFYRLYPISCNTSAPADQLPYTQHTLGSVTEEIGVLDAIIWSDGMVESNEGTPNFHQTDPFSAQRGSEAQSPQMFTPDRSNGKRESIDSGGLTEKPTAWAVIPPHSSSTGIVQILASRSDSIVVIDPMDSTDQRLAAKGPFLRIVPSPNGKFLALLTGPGSPKPYTVWVVSSDFSRELSEFSLVEQSGQDFLNDGPPTQMVWCGGHDRDSSSETIIIPDRHTFNDSIHLVTEIDGIRILSLSTCESLSKVASCTSMVFTPGSTSPAAILKKLTEAVDVCVQAAGREFEPRWQQRLIKAAAFGKVFLDVHNPEPFVKMAKTLRVLNAVRDYKIGIPLTYEQYISHHPDQLISRLAARSQYLLALRLTEFLNLSPAGVLRHWARNVIVDMDSASSTDPSKSGTSPAAVCRRIVSKLKDRHGVSPADIAEIAWSLGKTKLCTELLAHELKPTKQIPLLMRMDKGKEALQQSIKSLDPDLIQTVLWETRARKPLAEFLSVVEGKDEAISTLRIWAKASVERALSTRKNLPHQKQSTWDPIGNCIETFVTKMIGARRVDLAKIKSALKFYLEDSERVFEQGMLNESIRLLGFQKTLILDIMKSYGSSGTSSTNQAHDPLKKNFMEAMISNKGLTMPSLTETIRQCVKLGLRKQADKLRTDFKVPEKRFWYVKMKALVELKDWDGLENWSGKKSPIGFEPFVNHLLAMGCHREALRYVPKCEARNRVELYVKCGEWVTAGEECADRGETAKLIELRQRCPSPHVAAALSKMIEDLAA
ncbi:hypothetical protein H4Q26_014035 [Puccinia striiformis f. sp. tritici PST-130]|nr:hypothetical protein H4Q26_014035 [Puccinia striiformis f. sp. tritici PST-130]